MPTLPSPCVVMLWNEAYSILFGEILGISSNDVIVTFVASLLIIFLIAIVYRPLLFSSLDEEVAEGKGLPTLLLGIIFMVMVAIAASVAVQVVGVLLIFSLMITPAAFYDHDILAHSECCMFS
jgi:zinc/manganese transport system permease protein